MPASEIAAVRAELIEGERSGPARRFDPVAFKCEMRVAPGGMDAPRLLDPG